MAEPVVAPEPVAEAPKLLAGKYNSQDELNKGIMELAQHIGAERAYQTLTSAMRNPSGAPESLALNQPPPADMTIDTILEKAGVNQEAMAGHYREHGSVSDGDASKIASVIPVSKAIVNEHLAMRTQAQDIQQAATNQTREMITNQTIGAVGGVEQWNNLKSWAENNLDEGQRTELNRQLEGPTATPESAQIGVQYMLARHREAVGATNTQPLIAGSAPATTTRGYTSVTEFVTAQREAMSKFAGDPTKDPEHSARMDATDGRILQGVNP